jgi:hypothetical protein
MSQSIKNNKEACIIIDKLDYSIYTQDGKNIPIEQIARDNSKTIVTAIYTILHKLPEYIHCSCEGGIAFTYVENKKITLLGKEEDELFFEVYNDNTFIVTFFHYIIHFNRKKKPTITSTIKINNNIVMDNYSDELVTAYFDYFLLDSSKKSSL